jgi:hypothetical protein
MKAIFIGMKIAFIGIHSFPWGALLSMSTNGTKVVSGQMSKIRGTILNPLTEVSGIEGLVKQVEWKRVGRKYLLR